MKMNSKLRGGFTLVELLVVIVIIAALAGLASPAILRSRKKADQTEAVSNARQIGISLMDFDTEYGSFPDTVTAAAVAAATETTVVSGASANDRFRQLIRAGIVESEAIFYAKTAFTRKPDGIINGEEALKGGEVGFSFFVKADGGGLSSAGNSGRPILVTPSKESLLATGDFDPDPFDSKAVILKLDNSVTSVNIIKASGRILLSGKAPLATGEDTVWGTGITPAFAHPTKRQ